MSFKAEVEAIIYAAEEPVTVEQIAAALKEAGAEASDDQVIGPSDDRNSAAPEETVDNEAVAKKTKKPDALAAMKAQVRVAIERLTAEYAAGDRGIEIRAIAGGYRMATKPEHHDVVRSFARNLKPPVRLSLAALETLAVIAYKQPITVPEINEIRGVDAGGVIGTLLDRRLITTAGRKQVIGRPILYKTTREFLLRFGLKDLNELPSMEEFEKLMNEAAQEELLPATQPQTHPQGMEEKPPAEPQDEHETQPAQQA